MSSPPAVPSSVLRPAAESQVFASAGSSYESTIRSGTHQLHHRHLEPAAPAWARLLIIHGYGEHSARYEAFMRWLSERGVASDAIDLRGHGRSTGRRGYISQWDEYLDDLQVAMHAAREAFDRDVPLFVLGHSHGGLVVAVAAERGVLRQQEVTGIILVAPYLGTRVAAPIGKRALTHLANRAWPWLRVRTGFKREWLTRDPEMAQADLADALLTHTATPRWYLTMRRTQARCAREAARLTLPLLCLIGEADRIADPDVVSDFVDRAGAPDKSIYTYPHHLHELLRETGRGHIYADLLHWLQARVEPTAR